MPISVKLDPIGADIRLLLDEVKSPEFRRQMLADTAREEIAKARAQNRAALGRDVAVDVYVDGRRGAAIEEVRPDGVIVAEFDVVGDMLAWIGEQLVKHSPVGDSTDRRPGHPGMYRSSHVFIVDGNALDPGEEMPERWQTASFVNVTPYARKIERGLSDQHSAVYHTVAELARQRFGNVAQVRFGYEAPLFGAISEWASKTAMASPGRRGARRDEWLRRNPAIVVTLR